jgi:pSer/pThr/pTyr-binding forkhead associated (FHA) protein
MTLGKLVEQESGQVFPLGFEVVTLGRHEENTVVLPDPNVSRHHAEITAQGGRLAIRDLDSANGTYVNGERIQEPYVLRHGDTVRVGQSQFLVEISSAAARQVTLVEGLKVPAEVAAAERRRRSAWIGAAAVVGLLVLVALAALLWPKLRGENGAAATPLPDLTAVALEGETALPSPVTPATPAATSVPTVAPPTPEPTLPPAPQPSPAPSDTPTLLPTIGVFRANPPIIDRGRCTRLEWGLIENANRVFLSDVGPVSTSGKMDICPGESKLYRLEARGAGGAAEESVQVTVQEPKGSIIEYLRVVPSIIAPGGCAQLEWGKVDNAISASIEPGIGGVGTPGSMEVCPSETTVYELTASSPEGTHTARATLIVSSDTSQKPVIAFFSARPASIEAGQCVTLTWGKVDYATEVTIDNGIGGVATPGETEICPGRTTSYLMTALGPGGTTESEVVIAVSPVQLAELADLFVESIVFEPNPCFRVSKCKVRIKVRNDGPVYAGPFVLRWAPEGAEAVPVEWDVPGLAAGREEELTYTWLPSRVQESWPTTASVDVYGEVEEIEEDEGNSLTQEITVLEP